MQILLILLYNIWLMTFMSDVIPETQLMSYLNVTLPSLVKSHGKYFYKMSICL